MTAQQAVRVARPRGEVSPGVVAAIRKRVDAVEEAQRRLEHEVADALADGASLNELARQTGIAKTTLLRWAKR